MENVRENQVKKPSLVKLVSKLLVIDFKTKINRG